MFPTNPIQGQYYFDGGKTWIYNDSFDTWYKFTKRGVSFGAKENPNRLRNGEITSDFIDLKKPVTPNSIVQVAANFDMGSDNIRFRGGRCIFTIILYDRNNQQIKSIRWTKIMNLSEDIGVVKHGFGFTFWIQGPTAAQQVCTKVRMVAQYNLNNNTRPVRVSYTIINN